MTGFNIGVNIGHSAGQTVFHRYILLILCHDGDTEQFQRAVLMNDLSLEREL